MGMCGLAMEQSFLTDNVVLAWSRILIWLARGEAAHIIDGWYGPETSFWSYMFNSCVPTTKTRPVGRLTCEEIKWINGKENQAAHKFLAEIFCCLKCCHSHCNFIDSTLSVPVNLFKKKWTSKCSVGHMYFLINYRWDSEKRHFLFWAGISCGSPYIPYCYFLNDLFSFNDIHVIAKLSGNLSRGPGLEIQQLMPGRAEARLPITSSSLGWTGHLLAARKRRQVWHRASGGACSCLPASTSQLLCVQAPLSWASTLKMPLRAAAAPASGASEDKHSFLEQFAQYSVIVQMERCFYLESPWFLVIPFT